MTYSACAGIALEAAVASTSEARIRRQVGMLKGGTTDPDFTRLPVVWDVERDLRL